MRSLAAPIIIAFAIIISVIIGVTALKYKFRTGETITVTGLAEKDFISDQIVWQGSFSRTGLDLKTAYEELKSDEKAIRTYLTSAGIPANNIIFSSVNMNKQYQTRYDQMGQVSSNIFTGYLLTGSVTVDSRDLDVVEKMSREITGLLQQGIELNSSPPRYYYSKLNELKIDLLSKASADARQRAESIANHSEANLGKIKKANMGVFQITGKNSNEDYSYGGVFNTSSKEKTASITLKVDYQVE